MDRLTFQRALIVAFACLIALDVAFDVAGLYTLTGEMAAAKTATEVKELGPGQWFLFAVLVVNLVALGGAWWDKKWARITMLLCTVPFVLYLTPTVEHPLESMLSYLTDAVEGAIFAVLWAPDRRTSTSLGRAEFTAAPEAVRA